MMFKKGSSFLHTDRRQFIKQFGYASLLFLPLIRQNRALAASDQQKKLFLLITPNGTVEEYFWPKSGTETNFELNDITKVFAAHKQDMIICDNIMLNNHRAADHNGIHCLLTGYGNGYNPQQHYGKVESVDQFLGRSIGKDSHVPVLNLGIHVGNYANFGRTSFLKRSNGGVEPIVPMEHPKAIFERLFANFVENTQPGAMDELKSRNKLVVDFLVKNYNPNALKLSGDEKSVISNHFDLIRDLQANIEKGDTELAFGCQKPNKPTIDYSFQSGAINIDELAKDQFELALAAMSCGLTNIVTMQFLSEGSTSGVTSRIGSAGRLNLSAIHGISHRSFGFGGDGISQGSIPQNVVQANGIRHRDIEIFYAGFMNQMLTNMKKINPSMLDNGMYAWTPTFARSYMNHTSHRMPFVIFGKGGGKFKTGRWIKFPDGTNSTGLLATMLDVMGDTTTKKFGDPAFAQTKYQQLYA